MPFDKKKKNEETKESVQLPILSTAEINRFGEWIAPFKTVEEAMIDYGALGKIEHLGKTTTGVKLTVTEDQYGNMKSYIQPSRYDLFWNEYDQWQKAVRRREFAKGKADMEYQKMAESLVASATFDVEPIPENENQKRVPVKIEPDNDF